MDSPHGWQRDPFGIHEDRYFSRGEPTKLVRDRGVESYDDAPNPSTSAATDEVVPRGDNTPSEEPEVKTYGPPPPSAPLLPPGKWRPDPWGYGRERYSTLDGSWTDLTRDTGSGGASRRAPTVDHGRSHSPKLFARRWVAVTSIGVAILAVALIAIAGGNGNPSTQGGNGTYTPPPSSGETVSRSDAMKFFDSIDAVLQWQSGPPETGADSGPLALVVELTGSSSDLTEIEVNQAIGDPDSVSTENATFVDAVQQYAGAPCVPWIDQQLNAANAQGLKSYAATTCQSVNMSFTTTGNPDDFATLDLSPPVAVS
jgi:hypothetical protein